MKLYPGHSAVVGVGVGVDPVVVLIVEVGCKLAMYGEEEVALEPESTSWYTLTELMLQ